MFDKCRSAMHPSKMLTRFKLQWFYIFNFPDRSYRINHHARHQASVPLACLPVQDALLGRARRHPELLQMHQGAVHTVATPPAQDRKPQTKLPHLEVSADGTVTEAVLRVFKQQLASFKRLFGIKSDDPGTVLQSLPPSAYNLLFARHGDDLTAQTEKQLIDNIQALMVRHENKLSHVVRLQRMRQDRSQTVAHFSANVRAAARMWQFRVTCECNKHISYEDHMVLYQLLSGLEDTEVQADLLAKPELTLAEAEKYVTDREMAKRTRKVTMNQGEGDVGRLKSTYKVQKSVRPEATSTATLCRHCGEAAHHNRRLQCKGLRPYLYVRAPLTPSQGVLQ